MAAATVIVLHRPEEDDLANVLRLASETGAVIAVVNHCDGDLAARLPVVAGVRYIRNFSNAGLARALNQGVDAAVADGADYVLMLDQDSRPDAALRGQLVAAARAMEETGRQLGCIGPLLVDRKRTAARVGGRATEQGASVTLATSGTLLTRRAWCEVGPMWDALFIDGIDHEWCFRARNLGFETVVSPGVYMEHDMGDDAITVFGRFKPVHRSAMRHYFIVRNTLWLARRGYIPLRWRANELAKLAYRAPAYLWFSTDRARTLRNLGRALRDGLRAPRMAPQQRFL